MTLKSGAGVLLVIVGIILGLWLGLWVMLIGGIAQLVNAIKMTPVNAMGIALGIIRIMFSGIVGWLSGTILVGTGAALLK